VVAAGWRRTLITCVTAVHFVDLVTTFRGELPVTSGHFGYKGRLGIGRAHQLWLVMLLGGNGDGGWESGVWLRLGG